MTDPDLSRDHEAQEDSELADDHADKESSRRRLSVARLGTGLLLVIMLVAGLAAAFMVTPRPDEEALVRPTDTDLVMAAGPPASWDPAVISDSASAQLVSQVFEGLTVLDATSQVRPALAESWSVEDEGRRIVFVLRDGLTFSDGSPLDAQDVRRSWLRVIDPAHPSPLSSLLDDVAGAAAHARGEVSADAVGIHADGRRLSVELVRPASYFPVMAAVPSLAIVPESIDDLAPGPREGRSFPASGPYVPLDQELGEVLLVANDAYWAGPPPTDRITVVTDIGGRSEVDVFEDEAVDWTRVTPEDAAWIRYDQRLGPQLRFGDEMVVEYLGFDTTRPPFDDRAARRAVAMAVDWRRLADGDDPRGESVTSIVPPGIAGRGDSDFVLPHDPEAARAALAAAGYPGGAGFPAVSLATYGIGQAAAIAYELQRELGIEVRVEQWSFDDHGAILLADTPAMWTMAWSADYPHAHDFLGLLLRSDSSANVGRWSDAGYDALIEAAAATPDGAEQVRLYSEAQAILREEVPLIPLGYGSSWALSREGLAGSDISGVGLVRYADLAWQP
ncbi:MAG TPA: ABC transporter substrate-binding protein [Candidatus Limnocylindrales bacterium]|nr:ABC transporter substrate-binding protein [Candidatus Limnocylindrales bacterium]